MVPAGNDNLCLLIKVLAMQHNHLQQLMELLCPTAAAAAATGAGCISSSPQEPPATAANLASFPATEHHAVLLHVVALEAAAVPAACQLPGVPLAEPGAGNQQQQQEQSEAQESSSPAAAGSWLQYVVCLLQAVWAQALAAAAPTAGVCSQPTATAHVLEAARCR